MLLSDLMNGIETTSYYDGNTEVSSVALSSKECRSGALFIAMKGVNYNGHNYIEEAITKGASIVIGEEDNEHIANYIKVANVRQAYSLIMANYYNHPERMLKIIAVVGTNGKSSTSYFAYEMLRRGGYKTGLIGTGKVRYGDILIETTMTTPDPRDLYRYLRQMADAGIEYVVMEVSAHAISLDKMYGIKCEIGLFTNFSQDHLDYFKSMDIYKRVKMSYFNSRYMKVAIVNSDDECGQEIIGSTNVPVFTYGLDNPADVFAIDLEYCIEGTRFVVNMLDEIAGFATEIIGKYNVYNILGASLIARLVGVEMYSIRNTVSILKPCEGRMNIMRVNKRIFVIDYAHTPEGLKSVLNELRRITDKKITVVFGCGGNRDRSKRALMGRIADLYADEIVVTSDNPRNEKRMDIINDIVKGISAGRYVILPERTEAIKYAYKMSDAGNIILVAGKGAEKYTEEGGKRIYYSDKEAILSVGE